MTKIVFRKKPAVLSQTSLSHTKLYSLISRGLFPKPVKLGVKSSVWIQSEVDAICAAYAAGLSDAELVKLVAQLEADRRKPIAAQ